jgi:hypothetical protein
MEQKDMYTLEELYDNLPIALSELARRSGINEVTLARIRDGFFARRSTVVKLLIALSKVYGFQLSLSNVTGYLIRDKKALGSQLEKSHTDVTEQEPVPATSNAPYDDSSQIEEAQNRIVARSDGLIPCKAFFEKQSHFEKTFSESSWMRWVKEGIKPRSGERETLDVTELDPPASDGKYFFTPEQAQKAIEILRRLGKLES